MARKKKLLPKNFEELLQDGNLDRLKAIFETCDVNARGGVFKQSALAFNTCPDELAYWLMEQGADILAGDRYDETPLHCRAGDRRGRIDILLELGADVDHGEGARGTPLHAAAGAYNVDTARTLLTHGAKVDALNSGGLTPLAYALQRCSNVQIRAMAPLAELLLSAGASTTPDIKNFVARIGENFEFHRSNFNQDMVEETGHALDKLYSLFHVEPAPRRAMHDGKSLIVAEATSWEERHQELWQLLVPSSGAAETVQGELIRISGKIDHELEGNGGVNWDADFKKMADAFLGHIHTGKPLSAEQLGEAKTLVRSIKRQSGDPSRICEWAVHWVAQNPKPLKLPPPAYDR